MSPTLSLSQLQHYWRHGYVVQRGLIDEGALKNLRERLAAVIEGSIPAAPGMLVMRDVMIAKGLVKADRPEGEIAKVQDFRHDPVLFSYVEDARILDCVEQIIGANIQSIHTMLINKPPGVDGRHPLHQDLVYFPFRPADKIVAAQTALEPMTRENGCLTVVPGSHERGGLRDHEDLPWEGANAGYWGAVDVGAHPDRIHLEMEPGDTVFFHPVLLHGSGRNRTTGFRRAISSHYASAECVRIWDEAEGEESSRQFTLVRGAQVADPSAPEQAERPGTPDSAFDKLTRRSTRRG
jgi:phytanoyl-CoA hydroxylase